MDSYTITAAAKLLGVSRQTIYNYIDKEPDRFTELSTGGQRRITLQGLGLLRESIDKGTASTNVHTDKQPTRDGQGRTEQDGRGSPLREHVNELETTVKVLQAQLDGANALITSLQAQNATLERALAYAQELHLQTQKKLTGASQSLWARLFHRAE